MNSFRRKTVSWTLVAAIVASSGCCSAVTITRPTSESVSSHVREGDRVELLMKSGEKRKVDVTGIRPDALWVGYDGKVAYGEIQEVRVPEKRWSLGDGCDWHPSSGSSGGGGFNLGNCDGRAVVVVLAVVVVVVAVAWGVSELDKACRRR